MANCLPKELNEQEQRIVNDIMQRSNLNLEDATTIARTMIEWGYTIHEQDYNRLKIALKILKVNFPIKLLGYNKYGAKPYEIMFNGFIEGFDKATYELLKEVLQDE